METEPGEGWADAVSKILSIGKHSNKGHILAKAKREKNPESDDDESILHQRQKRSNDPSDNPDYLTKRLKPHAQEDALVENELKAVATRGVVHLFNVVKTVNPRSDKKKKKKKKKKKGKKKGKGRPKVRRK